MAGLFQKLTSQEAKALNVLFTRAGALNFPIGDQDFGLSFLDGVPLGQPDAWVEGTVNAEPFAIGLDSRFLEGYLEGISAGEDFGSLPDVLRPMVLEAAVSDLLDRLEKATSWQVVIEKVDMAASRQMAGKQLRFRLSHADGSRELDGVLSIGDRMLGELASMASSRPSIRQNADWLPITYCVEVGQTQLNFEKIKSIRPGDIVLLDSHSAGDLKSVTVRFADRVRLAAQVSQGRIEFIGKAQDHMHDLGPEWDDDEEQDPGVLEDDDVDDGLWETDQDLDDDEELRPSGEKLLEDADELPVNVVFEVARGRLPLGKLRSLTSGYTFELGKDISKPVVIRANGRIIGAGELVEIEQRVGVRVIDIFGNKDDGSA